MSGCRKNSGEQALNARAVMNVLKVGTFLGLLSETILNVALSRFMDVFGASANTVQWLTSGYMLVMGIFVPLTAFLIQRLTTRQLFLFAMGMFLLGTTVSAAASSFALLMLGRLVQAIGTSVMLPLMMNTVMVLNPPEKRGSAMGAALLIVLFAPAVGPTYGGLIVQTLNWRWMFLLMVPFAVFSLGFGWLCLKNVTEQVDLKLDLPSLALSVVGFGGVIYGLDDLVSVDVTGSTGTVALAVGLAAIAVFTWRQFRIANPLLEMRIFSYPMFSLGIVLITMTYMILFANFILMPMFLENVLGLTTFQSGLAVLPGGIIGAVLPPLFGRIYDRFGVRVIVPLGFAIMAAANGAVSLMGSATSSVWPVIAYCCVIVGLATLLTASQTNTLNQLPKDYCSHGTAAMNTMMLIGSALGASLFVGIMALRQKQCLADHLGGLASFTAAIDFAYLFVAALAVTGFTLALFFRRRAERR